MSKTTKLWINPFLELRHAINGWPAMPDNPDVIWLDQSSIDQFNAAIAKAKAESILVVNYELPINEGIPGGFIEIEGEVEVVELCDRGSCVYGAAGCFAEGMTGERCQARKVARLTKKEWEKWKKEYSTHYLADREIQEIDEHFENEVKG